MFQISNFLLCLFTLTSPVQPLTSFRIYLSHKNVNMETCGDENTKEKKGKKGSKGHFLCSLSFFGTTNRFMNPKNFRVEFKWSTFYQLIQTMFIYVCLPWSKRNLTNIRKNFPLKRERDKELIFDAAFNLLLIQYKLAIFEKISLSACLLLPSTEFDLILAS